jgi:hypothetical protein
VSNDADHGIDERDLVLIRKAAPRVRPDGAASWHQDNDLIAIFIAFSSIALPFVSSIQAL